uniref:Uncharacterized protein n=1 Tax=Anguilla anguilla TaxID=7936 RepID=A0A0E9WTR7_ANGAN
MVLLVTNGDALVMHCTGSQCCVRTAVHGGWAWNIQPSLYQNHSSGFVLPLF